MLAHVHCWCTAGGESVPVRARHELAEVHAAVPRRRRALLDRALNSRPGQKGGDRRMEESNSGCGRPDRPPAALHANAMLRPVFLLSQVVVLVGQAELARFAFPRVGGTAPAPAPAPARPIPCTSTSTYASANVSQRRRHAKLLRYVTMFYIATNVSQCQRGRQLR